MFVVITLFCNKKRAFSIKLPPKIKTCAIINMPNERGVVFMSRGKINQKYTGEFKQKVVEHMRDNTLSYRETERIFEIPSRNRVQKWERIYLEEGAAGLYVERRGRGSSAEGIRKGRPPKLEKNVEEDLIAENQRLRMELDYLQKLNALVQQRQLQERKRK